MLQFTFESAGQFRQSAVEIVSPEHPIAEVAHSLGIGHSTSDKWVHAHRRQAGQLAALNQEQKRIRELERQVAHLQEVNDILKKIALSLATSACIALRSAARDASAFLNLCTHVYKALSEIPSRLTTSTTEWPLSMTYLTA
ncbi:transposase [Burkholderiaceae bacterium]|nr:transposase [Burkholderiaceae bacterium]